MILSVLALISFKKINFKSYALFSPASLSHSLCGVLTFFLSPPRSRAIAWPQLCQPTSLARLPQTLKFVPPTPSLSLIIHHVFMFLSLSECGGICFRVWICWRNTSFVKHPNFFFFYKWEIFPCVDALHACIHTYIIFLTLTFYI